MSCWGTTCAHARRCVRAHPKRPIDSGAAEATIHADRRRVRRSCAELAYVTGGNVTMNKLRILIFIGAGISLLYSLIKSIVLRMPGRSRDSARKRMAQAEWLDADSRDGAFVKVTGKVHTREAGERF